MIRVWIRIKRTLSLLIEILIRVITELTRLCLAAIIQTTQNHYQCTADKAALSQPEGIKARSLVVQAATRATSVSVNHLLEVTTPMTVTAHNITHWTRWANCARSRWWRKATGLSRLTILIASSLNFWATMSVPTRAINNHLNKCCSDNTNRFIHQQTWHQLASKVLSIDQAKAMAIKCLHLENLNSFAIHKLHNISSSSCRIQPIITIIRTMPHTKSFLIQ